MRARNALFLALLFTFVLVPPAAGNPPIGATISITMSPTPSFAIPRVEVSGDLVDFPPNDLCSQAHEWPVADKALSSGALGQDEEFSGVFDAQDWSKLLMFRTERLEGSLQGGAATLGFFDSHCHAVRLTDGLVRADENGWYNLRAEILHGVTFTPYNIEWEIIPYDAGKPGDIGNTQADAHPLVATTLPGTGPQAALPGRHDTIKDMDYFHVTVTPPTDGTGIDLVSLVTVTVMADCSAPSAIGLHLQRPGALPDEGGFVEALPACGPVKASCIAVGSTDFYAKAYQTLDGGGYNIDATIAPLQVVTLQSGNAVTFATTVPGHVLNDREKLPEDVAMVVSTSESNEEHPWCDETAPMVLDVLMGIPGLVGTVAGLVPEEIPGDDLTDRAKLAVLRRVDASPWAYLS